MMKSLSTIGIGGNFLTWLKKKNKTLHKKSVVNIILSGEVLEVFSLRSSKRQECSFLRLLFNTVLEILTNAIR